MTTREEQLRDELKSADDQIAVDAAVALWSDLLSNVKAYEEAETVLLGVLGKQSTADGFMVQLCLAELYVHLNEHPRALRFLKLPLTSSIDLIKKAAEEMASKLH